MSDRRDKSVVGLIFGILSLILWLVPLLGLPVAMVGLVFSIGDLKAGKKLATTALVCSIIGLVLVLINSVVGAYLGAIGDHAIANLIFS
jgi:hypothetical protein